MVLTLTVKSRRSWDFTVSDECGCVAYTSLGGDANVTVQGERYLAYREGWIRGDFVLEAVAGPVLARARKPSFFRRRLTVVYADRLYGLCATSMFSDDFILVDGVNRIGSISKEGFLDRGAAVTLPNDMPLPIRVFVAWLTVRLWSESDIVLPG